MLKNLIVILCTVSTSALYAQETAVLSGRLVDSETEAAIPLVTVTIESESSGDPFGGAITDEDGRFVIDGLEPGNYTLQTTTAGYETQRLPVFIGDKNFIFSLGEIELSRDETEVEEILVTGTQTTANDLDRRVFSLDDNFAQSSGSILGALKGLPGVTVDQEGKVWLRGSDKVTILIDGKPSALTGFGNQRALDSVPAANAASIEIINNPSARYEAAGMAGVINIVYKKENESGFSGDAGLSVGVGQLSKPRYDLPTEIGSFSNNQKLIPSVNLNYGTDAMLTYLQAEVLIQDHLPNNEFTTRVYDDGSVILSQVPENREQVHYIVRGGADWTLNSGNLFSLSGIYDFETHTDVAQVPFIDAETGQRLRYWFWREEEDTGFASIRADYKIPFVEPGHELKAAIEYTRGWEDEAYFLNEESPVRVGTDATHLVATENTVPVTIDYVRPLSAGRIESGIRYQKRWIPITYDVVSGNMSVIYPGLGDWSEWGEDIIAGYFNFVHESASFDIESGLRVEQTDVYYDIPEENIYYPGSDSYDYFEIYPNVKFTYILRDSDNIYAAYNRRVDRPGEPQLRIFPKYDDPELLKVGNPYLRPQFTDVVEIGYQRLWDSGSASVSLYWRDIEDEFLRVYAIDETNPNYDIINKIYQNVGTSAQNGVELIFSQDITDAWRLSGSVNWFQLEIDEYDTLLLFPTVRPFNIPASKGDTWDLKINNLVNLTDSTELQVSYVYYTDRSIPQGTQSSRSSLDLGLRTTIWGDRADIVLTVTDALNKFGLRQQIQGDGFIARYENFFETQVVTLGMKYRF